MTGVAIPADDKTTNGPFELTQLTCLTDERAQPLWRWLLGKCFNPHPEGLSQGSEGYLRVIDNQLENLDSFR
jgi:hypothetical protein